MSRWNCFWGWVLVVMIAAVARTLAADAEEGKLVPSTRTDYPMDTHIWIGNPPRSTVPGVSSMISVTTTSRNIPCFYVAEYEGGDWNVHLKLKARHEIEGGALLDLSKSIEKTSHGKIPNCLSTTPVALPILANDAIKPPFLFLTGTKDFVFTDQEVQALRLYLIRGGCLWVDNGSPGKDGAFDKAFRREIVRVLSSSEHKLKPLSPSHPLYTRGWYELKTLPAGSTGLNAPLEQIEMDGVMAVLYMPNGYAPLWTRPEEETGPMVDAWQRATELGMNCVVHLLTRWDEWLMTQQVAPSKVR